MTTIVILAVLGAAGFGLSLRQEGKWLAAAVLGMGILLPSFKVASGLPDVRPEELLLVLFLLCLPWLRFKLEPARVAEIGRAIAALLIVTLVSIIWARLFLHCRAGLRDLFELIKPLKYYFIILLVASAGLEKKGLERNFRWFWIFSGCFILACFLEYWNIGGIRQYLLPYAPDKVALSRLASPRIMGLMGNPNYTGLFLMLVISFAFSSLLFYRNSFRTGIFYVAMFSLAGMAEFLTMSRTAMAATLVSLVFIGAKFLISPRVSRRQAAIALGVIVLIMAVFLAAAGEEFLWRYQAALHLDTNTSFQAKLVFWQQAWDLYKQSPIFGWGPAKSLMTGVVDNEYLLIARRYGLVGLIIYLGFYLSIFRLIRNNTSPAFSSTGGTENMVCSPAERDQADDPRNENQDDGSREDDSVRVLGTAMQGITLGFLVFNCTAGTFYSLQLMAVYAALVGLAGALNRLGAPRPGSGRNGSEQFRKDSGRFGNDTGGFQNDAGRFRGVLGRFQNSWKRLQSSPCKEWTGSKRLLIVLSHRFPTAADPVKGVYVQEQLRAILQAAGGGLQAAVISPVPWAPKLLWFRPHWRAYGQIQHRGLFLGCPVYYPRYLVIPGTHFFFLQGICIWLACLFLVFRLTRTKKQVSIHAHTVLPDGLAAVLFKYFNPTFNVVCTAHGSDILRFPGRNRITLELTRLTLSKADRVAAVSGHLVQAVRDLGCRQVERIANGVNLQKFTLTQANLAWVEKLRGRWTNCQFILFVGHLMKEKGVIDLLQAFACLPENTVLFLVGQSHLKQEIEDFVSIHSLQKRVFSPGPVPHEEVKLWLEACDVFVLPSYSEGLPVALLEAMGLAKPVVVTRVGGVPEIITDGLNGLLIDPGDVEGLKKAILKLLANRELAGQLGREARNTVETGFTWQLNGERMVRLYQELMAE